MSERPPHSFGEAPGPPPGDGERPRPGEEGRPAPGPSEAGDALPAAVEEEEEALRRRMAGLGLVPVDRSKLEEGPPLSHEDWQALHRFHRDPAGMTQEEKLHVIRAKRRYASWDRAYEQVLLQASRETGGLHRSRN